MRGFAIGLLGLLALAGAAQAQTFSITRAEWSTSDGGRLRVEGGGIDNRTITIKNAGSGATLGSATVNEGQWDRRFTGLTPVPCRVRAEQSGGGVAERDVANRPANCGPVAGADAQAPTAPANLAATAAGSTQITLGWTASTDNVGVTGYRIERCQGAGCTNFAQIATTTGTGTTFSNSGLTANTRYSYRVRANDAAGNLSAYSNTASATTAAAAADAQAPTAPANLTATAAGGSQINLAWSTATDNVGVTANRIERCTGATCTNFAEITSVGNVTTFSNTGLTSNTTYRYRVRAADAAGNLGPYSNIANGTTAGGAVGRPNVSINSTGQSRATIPTAKVNEQTQVLNSANFQVLAVNDLGMHCGDLDTRVSSILPPFNVVHAVALQKAARPVKLSETQVEIRYSAASNSTDPILNNPNAILDPNFAGVYKTNFWDIARTAYVPFYPAGVLAAFYPATANILDLGLPVPDVERLYLGDKQLAADQQLMPGKAAPYSTSGTTGNVPQAFTQFVGTQPFFTTVKNPQGVGFGYTSQVNWFEAAGIPISTFDDAGRENAYPLMRVQAVAKTAIGTTPAGTVLATLDTVIPVSGEADCKACHAHSADGGNGTGIGRLGNNVTVSIEDPLAGTLPLPVSIEWATDKNVLRLHDAKHATTLEASSPVVCQTCHYTPALDLAQFGPNTPEEAAHKSMSAVMHKSHGDLKTAGFPQLFPDMPGPVGRNPAQAQNVLNETCYMCHPGRRVQCMRGAMGQAGVVCQDCHGNMTQVGTDFSRNVTPANPGAFTVAADFYTNPNTPRVPWANEPGCGSCHTGDAMNNLFTANGTSSSPAGVVKAADNVRLLQAYRTGDLKATPIVPANKRFAENVVTATENAAAANNPKLYRVSTGHGGLFCEACHGSTHAEWASQPTTTLANANDNKTPQQLQGHNGTIIECRTCHNTTNPGFNLNGPHGMHPVADSNWTSNHKDFVSANGTAACKTCHGSNGLGTPLSKTPIARTLDGRNFTAGQTIGCTNCHSNKI